MSHKAESNEVDDLLAFTKVNRTEYSYVYIISCEGLDLVKVGHTSVPMSRFKSFQTQTPYKNNLIYAVKCFGDMRHIYVEKLAHVILRESHSNGEWFLTTEYEAIKAVRAAFNAVHEVANDESLSWDLFK